MTQARASGVLLPVSALPGPYGIGTLGEPALRWIDQLRKMGFSRWQILPLGTLDAGNSPYAGDSAFAGNSLLIDYGELASEGFLTEAEAETARYPGTPHTADYAFARQNRRLLKTAFNRLTPPQKEAVRAFAAARSWLPDYSLFAAIREAQQGRPWQEWGALADYATAQSRREEFANSCLYYQFEQYIFDRQWSRIKAYAAQNGVAIIGDVPLYVSQSSCDVWAHRALFDVDEAGFPRRVAGVPPDYFSADGQLWGNPLYDWAAMAKDGYAWWIARLTHALTLYDTVRIDHFRGLASYWAIPAGAASARAGHWEKGPGTALFAALRQALPALPLIAEDLGTFGEDVITLLEETGLPGMRVIQFGFDPPGDSGNSHRPHNYPVNVLAYTGTHDNNTLLGWLWEATPPQREAALRYCGYRGDRWQEGGFHAPACRALIETVWRSAAFLAVLPVQDMCGFGRDTRTNIPGVPESNWRYRVVQPDLDRIDTAFFRELNALTGRCR